MRTPLWTTWESNVNSLVLSGAITIVLSGARDSCYQARALPEISSYAKHCARRNGSNKDFFEILSNLGGAQLVHSACPALRTP